MQRLGFERFMVAGHDRGARTGYRMALEHPERDTKDLEAGRAITCPLLVIVGGRSHTSKFYRYEEAWRRYATHLVR